ncbi:hypothetical protein GCM10009560_72730 [Nonomuraea longicatena]|uniref:Uncharacterized protein n=1 Tax=Nonomuraea longicatena TaxID=83682 RepID=A0ABP4BLX3_9ACTN
MLSDGTVTEFNGGPDSEPGHAVVEVTLSRAQVESFLSRMRAEGLQARLSARLAPVERTVNR